VRIRSIRPEFWRSDDIARLEPEQRLTYIGLWSYADDNGVGRDDAALIAADLFAHDLSRDPRETLARITRALAQLSEGGQITRYEVNGRRFFHITSWDEHQRIDRPARPRYPLPTCGDAEFVEPSRNPREPSRNPRDWRRGEGEKGRRGEGEKGTSMLDAGASSPHPESPTSRDDRFPEFWDAYPRKVARPKAAIAWRKAIERSDPDVILAAIGPHAEAWARHEAQYTPHPATWLNRDGWLDSPVPPPRPVQTRAQESKREVFAAWDRQVEDLQRREGA
jgi:hypothetical protein